MDHLSYSFASQGVRKTMIMIPRSSSMIYVGADNRCYRMLSIYNSQKKVPIAIDEPIIDMACSDVRELSRSYVSVIYALTDTSKMYTIECHVPKDKSMWLPYVIKLPYPQTNASKLLSCDDMGVWTLEMDGRYSVYGSPSMGIETYDHELVDGHMTLGNRMILVEGDVSTLYLPTHKFTTKRKIVDVSKPSNGIIVILDDRGLPTIIHFRGRSIDVILPEPVERILCYGGMMCVFIGVSGKIYTSGSIAANDDVVSRMESLATIHHPPSDSIEMELL